MELTLVRHGATEWNALRRFQGRTDLPLSTEGRAQARAIAATLASDPAGAIFSSDLARAVETANIVAKPHGLEVTRDERLREFDFGRWEGMTWDEIVAAYPHLAGHGSTAAKLYAPDGGESFAAVCARVAAFLADLQRKALASAIVVTHAGPLHAIFSVLELDAPSRPGDNLSLRFTPGGITRLTLAPVVRQAHHDMQAHHDNDAAS